MLAELNSRRDTVEILLTYLPRREVTRVSPGSKHHMLLLALARPQGATREDLSAASGLTADAAFADVRLDALHELGCGIPGGDRDLPGQLAGAGPRRGQAAARHARRGPPPERALPGRAARHGAGAHGAGGRGLHARVPADLGDHRCQVDLAALTVPGSVASATDRRTFTTSDVTDPLPGASGLYNGGVLAWTAGANAGLRMEVKSWDAPSRTLVLFLAMPYPPTHPRIADWSTSSSRTWRWPTSATASR
jgi:hypothetical protein